MTTKWSVNGAIAAQSEAHDRLQQAIDQQCAVEIWLGECRLTTCANMDAARMWIGKSKRYTVRQQGEQS